ncbi:OprO/OprP family phosphate-selective porin [Pyxidicoccus xibeiensis]|uniref:OprO/OprP family phosphate-selective porin n=1 Tax=Pyxidicoccus xibeiensis TaxID=2906759 RepID=UPI0020A7EE29|nr:porin [Pyxidicoccus xibeiensis]MCP3143612.1 OprO/OprP family phosphate-selective porin [Pyxidicoccus xibeiensis]
MQGVAGRSIAVAVGLLIAPLASAQTTPPEAPPAPPPETASPAPTSEAAPAPPAPEAATASSAPVTKASSEGITVSSADKEIQLRLKGYAHADARFFESDADRPGATTFLLRRARPIVEGTFFKKVDFRIMPDFGGGTATVQDAFVEFKPLKQLRLRAGKAKPEVGLERLQSATNIIFVERALPTNLVPNRDVGLQLGGELAEGVLSYSLGAYNGTPDGASVDTNLDDSFDLVARVFAHPFKATPIGALKKLGVGVSATSGQQFGSPTATGLAPLRTAGQQTFFSYRTGATAAEAVIASGDHVRFSPQGYFYFGPLGVLAEYVSSAQEVSRGGDRARLRHTSWQATASYVLIGGEADYKGVRPVAPFSTAGAGWGAVELAARYSALSVDPDSFSLYADPERSAREAKEWGLAANWYLSSNVRVAASYVRTTFEGGAAGGDRIPESVFFSRFQVSW